MHTAGLCESDGHVTLAKTRQYCITAGIVSKWKELTLWFLHHLIAPWFHSLARYDSSKNLQGVTPSEGDFSMPDMPIPDVLELDLLRLVLIGYFLSALEAIYSHVGILVDHCSSFYARQRMCYSACMPSQFRLSVCPSIRLSVRHTGGSVKNSWS